MHPDLESLKFSVRRALFSQPLGMTIRAFSQKLVQRGGPDQGAAPRILDIERLYNIEASGVIRSKSLRTGSASDIHSIGYSASIPSVIRRAIETCPDISEAMFFDLGCGKGLPLAVASEYPFKRIVGVELSPELCGIARRNADSIHRSFPDRTRIEVVEGDILKYDVPSGYAIVYIYNPGYPPLIRGLAERLGALQAEGRKFLVLYYNPAGARFFDRDPRFSRYFADHLEFTEDEAAASPNGNLADSVVIWQTANAPMFDPHPGADAPVKVVASGAAGRVGAGQGA